MIAVGAVVSPGVVFVGEPPPPPLQAVSATTNIERKELVQYLPIRRF